MGTRDLRYVTQVGIFALGENQSGETLVSSLFFLLQRNKKAPHHKVRGFHFVLVRLVTKHLLHHPELLVCD